MSCSNPAPSAAGDHQRIDRAGQFGTRRPVRHQAEGFFLERHRDVGAAPAGLDKGVYGQGKAVMWHKASRVLNILIGLPGKRHVDERRLAVTDRIAEYAVVVCHGASAVLWFLAGCES